MPKADDVLKELESIGVTRPSLKEAVTTKVEEVVLERGAPSPKFRDVRRDKMIESLGVAISYVDDCLGAMGGLKHALEDMRSIWTTDAEDLKKVVAPSVPVPAATSIPAPSPVSASEGAGYEEARQRAIEKIRGADVELVDKEEDVPFVGQERAVPEARKKTDQEVSIGTLGTLEPSLPLEDSNG